MKEECKKIFSVLNFEERLRAHMNWLVKYGAFDHKFYSSCYDCAGDGCSSCDYTGEGT